MIYISLLLLGLFGFAYWAENSGWRFLVLLIWGCFFVWLVTMIGILVIAGWVMIGFGGNNILDRAGYVGHDIHERKHIYMYFVWYF